MKPDEYFELQSKSINERVKTEVGEFLKIVNVQHNDVAIAAGDYTIIPIGATKEWLEKYSFRYRASLNWSNGDKVCTIDFSNSILPNMLPEIWVLPEVDSYNSKFTSFLSTFFDIDIPYSDDYDVDHFLSKKQVKNPEMFVRLILVPKPINRSHGAGFEKALKNMLDKKPYNNNDRINIDAVTYLKSMGEKFTKAKMKNQVQKKELIAKLVKLELSNEVMAELMLDELYKLAYEK